MHQTIRALYSKGLHSKKLAVITTKKKNSSCHGSMWVWVSQNPVPSQGEEVKSVLEEATFQTEKVK